MLSQDCSIYFRNNANRMFVFCFFFKDRSQQKLSQKTRTEILSAPECLQAYTIHHAVRWSQVMNDNLPTRDRGTDLVENDLGNTQYIQFPIALLFQTSCKQGICLQC